MRRIAVFFTIVAGTVAGALGYNAWSSEPNEIRLYLDLTSSTVAVNEQFLLDVEVENVDVDIESEVQINAVGLDQSLLNGIAVDGLTLISDGVELPQPPGDWTDYELDHALVGGSSMTLRYTLHATQPGTYQGEVSVWVDSEIALGVAQSKARTGTIRLQVQ